MLNRIETRRDVEGAGLHESSERCSDELVLRACRLLQSSDTRMSVASVAGLCGLSAAQLTRRFKSSLGLTPKAYMAELQAKRLRESLAQQRSVTEATLAAGYGSSSRVGEKSKELLGMTPSRYKSGGAAEVIYFALAKCSLGSVLVAQSRHGVCAITLADEPEPLLEDLQRRFCKAELVGQHSGFETTVAQVVGLIENPLSGVHFPLDVRGTVFQRMVWRALAQIPPGTTLSYAEVAQQIGQPAAVRAVAGACAANALAVAVPCHRVVRSDGALSGYRWGVERKRSLLLREGASPR